MKKKHRDTKSSSTRTGVTKKPLTGKYGAARDVKKGSAKRLASPLGTGMTLDDLHDAMIALCVDKDTGAPQVGAFFRIDWLVGNLQNLFSSAQPIINQTVFATSFNNINAGLALDPAAMGLQLMTTPSTPAGDLTLINFVPTIVLSEPGGTHREYNRIAIAFEPVHLKLAPDLQHDGNIRFYIDSTAGLPKFAVNATPPDPQVLADNQITPEQFATNQAAILASQASLDILDSFIASLPLLRVVEAMKQFGLMVPLEFEFTPEHVIIHGPSKFGAGSPCGPSAGTKVNTIAVPTSSPSTSPFTWQLTHTVQPVDPSPFTAPKPAFGYYYPLSVSFTPLSNNVIGPGVVASDEGGAFLFHWAYQLSGSPVKIDVTILNDPVTQKPQLQITIDAPFRIGGVAGFWMKIGCVSVPIASSSILGDVNPSVLTVTFSVVNTATGPAVVAHTSYDAKIDVTIFGPPVIDILLDIIMGSIGNRLLTGALTNMVNKLSFTLVDLSIMNSLAGATGWEIAQNFRNASFLIGAQQRRL